MHILYVRCVCVCACLCSGSAKEEPHFRLPIGCFLYSHCTIVFFFLLALYDFAVRAWLLFAGEHHGDDHIGNYFDCHEEMYIKRRYLDHCILFPSQDL